MASPPFANTFEGGSDGVTISGANSGGASGNAFNQINGSPTFSVDHPAHGTLGVKFTDPVAQMLVRWIVWDAPVTTDVWVRGYIWIPGIPTGQRLRAINVSDSAGGSCASFQITTGGVVETFPALGTGVQGTLQFPTQAIVRVEMRVLPHNTLGQIEIRWWSTPDSLGTPTETVLQTNCNTSTGTGANQGNFGAGGFFPTVPFTWYLDDVAVSTTGWIGPSQAPPAAPTLRVLRSPYRLN